VKRYLKWLVIVEALGVAIMVAAAPDHYEILFNRPMKAGRGLRDNVNDLP
jgi:hypothetical protein